MLKFHTACIEPLSNTFSLANSMNIDFSKDITDTKYFEKQLSFTLLVKALKRRLVSKCMDSVFHRLEIETQEDGTKVVKKNEFLLDSYASTSITSVQQSNEIYSCFSKSIIDQQNLEWSHDLIINSCEPELQQQLLSKLMTFKDSEVGGPLTFILLVQLVVHNNERTTRALQQKLQSFRITQVPEEDVEKAIGFISGIAQRLDSSGKMPPDMDEIVLDVFLHGTVLTFTNHLETLKSMESPKIVGYANILKEVSSKYQELKIMDRWNPTSSIKRASSFNTSQSLRPGGRSLRLQDTYPDPAPEGKPVTDTKGRSLTTHPLVLMIPHSYK